MLDRLQIIKQRFDEISDLIIQPDVIAKGADYRNSVVVGSDEVLARGGRVEYLPMEEGISSTAIVNRIVAAHQPAS